MNSAGKIEAIAVRVKEILEILGLSLEDPAIAETPRRVATMCVEEIFSGLLPENFPEIHCQPVTREKGQVVSVKNIPFVTFCEHHLVPIVGVAHVGYIPHEKLIGLSKLNRLVRYFSKRPQLQEKLGMEIADCLSQLLETEDVFVSLTAKHYCMIARGIEDFESEVETHVVRGAFQREPALRTPLALTVL